MRIATAKIKTFYITAKDGDRTVHLTVRVGPGNGLMKDEADSMKATLADALVRALDSKTIKFFHPYLSKIKVIR